MTLRHSLASHHEIPRHLTTSTNCDSLLILVVVASGHYGATFGGWRGAIWNPSNRFTSLAYQRHVREANLCNERMFSPVTAWEYLC